MPNPILRPEKILARTSALRFLIVLLAVGLASCSSTRLTDSWADPSLASLPQFRKVMVAVLSTDQTLRRSAEDALVANIKRTSAVASYTLMPEWEGGQLEAVKAQLDKAGIDGVVTLRLAGVDKEQTWVPDNYPGFGGGWRYGYSMVYSPGYLRTDTIVRVEISMYSVADDKLLYAARSRTFDPNDTAGTIKEIVDAVAEDLRKRGLVK